MKCPVCNSRSLIRIFSINSKEAAENFFPESPEKAKELKFNIRKLWNGDNCGFYSCSDCKFEFAWPFTPADIDTYSILYFKESFYPNDKWEYSRTLRTLKNINESKNANVLEIGAGNGAFLNKISGVFFDSGNIYSTEYSLEGFNSIRNKGYHCYKLNLKALEKEVSVKFDVIFMFQVLEHMDNIEDVFKSLNFFSKSGANLFISVPNGNFRRFLDNRGIHLDIPPVHIGRYKYESLNTIVEKYGWRIKDDDIEPQKYLVKVKKFLFNQYFIFNGKKKFELSKFRLIRKVIRYTILLYLVILNYRVLLKLVSKDTGTSWWVHLTKNN